jgi:hypothetical protein
MRAVLDLLGNVPAERVQDLTRDRAARNLLMALAPLALALGSLVYWADLRCAEAHYPMVLLLILTALIGFAQPRLSLLCALLIGACVPSAHALARLQGWSLPYPTDAWTPVFALIALVPALAGVSGGRWARRLLEYFHPRVQLPALILGTAVLIGLSIYQGVRVVAREPARSLCCSQHDPWQCLIRKVDHTFWVIPQGGSSSAKQAIQVNQISQVNQAIQVNQVKQIGGKKMRSVAVVPDAVRPAVVQPAQTDTNHPIAR